MPELMVKAARPWALRLLPPFPAVANRVLALVNSDEVAVAEISEIIKLDPTFTAEILRVANSALFGLVREISTIRHAVALLGLDRIKAIATLIALNSMVGPALRIEGLRKFWIHSLVTAILTEECARASGAPSEGAYTAGILHNLGTLGLMSAYPEEYNRMLEVSSECGFDLIQTERDLFEIDHCAAGAFLAEEWNFPDPIIAAIATHHQAPGGPPSLANLVRIGWRMADTLGYAAFPPAEPWEFAQLLELFVQKRATFLGQEAEEVKSEVGARIRSLGF